MAVLSYGSRFRIGEIGVGVRSFAIAKDSSTGKEMVCRP